MQYNTGIHDGFYWFETHELNIADFIKLFYNLLIDKYLIISYFDGSEYSLSEFAIEDGWEKIDGLIYTELINNKTLKKIAYDNYDQWILISTKTKVNRISNFVNYEYFSLIDWEVEIQTLDDKSDKDFIKFFSKEREKLKKQFWLEIKRINPINFISDGSKFIFVTNIKSEIDIIKKTVANTGNRCTTPEKSK